MILLAAVLTLGAESLAALLDRQLSGGAEYIVIETRSPDAVVGSRWQGYDEPAPMGSLMKPLIAVAYAARHGYRYPVLNCRERCWSPLPHGRLDLPHALAISCNNYFKSLMEKTVPARLTPLELLRWYAVLPGRVGEPGIAPVLRGLALAASEGTARGIGRGFLAKTGTSPCSHRLKGSGDGYVVVLAPAVRPLVAVMVRLHDRPGSHAAIVCGRILREWRGDE
ncbi:MAG: hypothetical protein IT160_05340 [Bryobacterales bacterium]|nr:hypothetical protein [Bryobacterales bacterium]